MVFASRQNDSRRYFQMSGAWFLFLGIIVAVGAMAVSTDTAARVIGFAFGCLLVGRGVLRLRDARVMREARDREASAGRESSRSSM